MGMRDHNDTTRMGGISTFKEVDTDYDKVYRWWKQKRWQPKVHHKGAETDTWECPAQWRGEHRSSLVVVADVTGEREGTTWGLGAAVATEQVEVLWEPEAWMEIMHGSTDVLEATAVVEACRALVCARRENVHTCLIMAFSDNRAAPQHWHTRKSHIDGAATWIAECAASKSSVKRNPSSWVGGWHNATRA